MGNSLKDMVLDTMKKINNDLTVEYCYLTYYQEEFENECLSLINASNKLCGEVDELNRKLDNNEISYEEYSVKAHELRWLIDAAKTWYDVLNIECVKLVKNFENRF